MTTEYPVRIVIASRVNFLRAEVEDDDGIPTFYRYTAAYRTERMEQDAPDRDPCFVVHVAFAFCNELADQFSRREGRELAEKRLTTEPRATQEIRLYAGNCGDLQFAIERDWTRKTFDQLCALHVPRRLARWFRRTGGNVLLPKPTPEQIARREHRNAVAQASRKGYTEAIQAGKTHDEAVQAARATVSERMR